MNLLMFILFLIAGGYLIIGAAIFRIGLNTKRAQRAKNEIGEKGLRIFYAAVGAVLIVIALVLYL